MQASTLVTEFVEGGHGARLSICLLQHCSERGLAVPDLRRRPHGSRFPPNYHFIMLVYNFIYYNNITLLLNQCMLLLCYLYYYYILINLIYIVVMRSASLCRKIGELVI